MDFQNKFNQQFNKFIPLYPPFEYPIQTLIELKKQVESKKLLICGEIHGIKENYEAYLFLIEKLKLKQVGMEIESPEFGFLLNYKPQEYSQNAGLEAKLKSMNWPDGRISRSLLNFLQILKQKGVKVFFFDNYTQRYNTNGLSQEEALKAGQEYALQRDYTMAKEIIANYDSKPTLVIAGNYHTRKDRVGSMAHFLEKMTHKALPNVSLEYGQGEYYNDSKINSLNESSQINTPSLVHNSNSDFSLQIPRANPVQVF